MKQSELEKQCWKLANLNGWVSYKGTECVGAPDRIFLKKGRGFCVEFERSMLLGGRTSAQVNEAIRLKEFGVPCYVVNSFQHFKKVVRKENNKFPDERTIIPQSMEDY